MERKWGTFIGKLFLSLFVVWIVANVVLWFFYPTTIYEIWKWVFLITLGSADLLFILGLGMMAVLGIGALIETGWFRKVFMLPNKYVVWLTKDLRRGEDDDAQHS